ncbi:MAG TPA: deoxyribodipyrimidine photo-lyase [Trebonia sp.]|nr:deoxyribodipyrimidine photo-lyase [Trebonia sp.]
MSAVLWFRRDLRLDDHPALLAAAADGPVTALFVLDDELRRPSGAPRLAFMYRTLRALDEQLREQGGGLTVRRGKPENVVPAVAAEAGASSVHVSADFGPYGRARDERVEQALGVPLVRTGSPYAVAPGRVTKGDGSPFKVYTPFYRAWSAHGWRKPAHIDPGRVDWRTLDGTGIPGDPDLPTGLTLPEAGEKAALDAWHRFRRGHLSGYDGDRDRPDLDRTSRLSPYLKWGSIHPRTILDGLGGGDSAYRRELAWREFYAAVLYFWPDSARGYFVPEMAKMPYASGEEADEAFAAWAGGRTGYPIVDAGMRQLLAEGWMHNRLRLIVASFLVKDLHIEWTRGARHFMRHLVDGDLASNQHNWQWTAGTGTDASPYFRVFNPVTQGIKFDPAGDCIRRYVPELRHLSGKEVHQPWEREDGVPAGYPERIVDHARERDRSLADYQHLRGR